MVARVIWVDTRAAAMDVGLLWVLWVVDSVLLCNF